MVLRNVGDLPCSLSSMALDATAVGFASVFVSTPSGRAQGEARQPLAEFAKANGHGGYMLHPNQEPLLLTVRFSQRKPPNVRPSAPFPLSFYRA